MKKMFCLAAAAALSMGYLANVQAAGVSLDIGRTGDSSSNTVYRLGTQFDFSSKWFQSDVGHVGGYWDAAYTYWEGGESASSHSISFTPMFVYEFAGETIRPYVEAGIGVALFSSTELDDHDIGTSFQFEDRIGAGLRFYNQELGLRAMHYSNAGIKQPNDGIETYSLHYRLSF
ncbi:acyloxyacyl hydrolase [Pseudomonas boanensis]|uniref:acyloxyacyl hydrolase n=1 Tax=Metapseudomonas boanensis TaxID=2822138 RepID=UPI0035D49DCB